MVWLAISLIHRSGLGWQGGDLLLTHGDFCKSKDETSFEEKILFHLINCAFRFFYVKQRICVPDGNLFAWIRILDFNPYMTLSRCYLLATGYRLLEGRQNSVRCQRIWFET
jgi:hypothetical protein